MGAFSVLLSTPLPPEATAAQQKCYVSYHLSALAPTVPAPDQGKDSDTSSITLLENRYLISAGGTTGLRTWEAAFHLGQYLCQNPSLIKDKTVLELGAGTGYLSILCAGFLGAKDVIASDGSDDVIYNIPENLYLNGLQDSDHIRTMDLKWGHPLFGTEEEEWNGGRHVDVVLGADVTYDERVIPWLVGTLAELMEEPRQVDEAYISATQRNEKTFAVFLDWCEKSGLQVDDVSFEVPSRERQKGPFYSDQVDIKICRVTRRPGFTQSHFFWSRGSPRIT